MQFCLFLLDTYVIFNSIILLSPFLFVLLGIYLLLYATAVVCILNSDFQHTKILVYYIRERLQRQSQCDSKDQVRFRYIDGNHSQVVGTVTDKTCIFLHSS